MAFEAQEDQDEVMNEINMTPLVDVMLVLLIIFIITIPVVQHAVKVELPRTSSTRDKTPPENLQLAVDAQGRITLKASDTLMLGTGSTTQARGTAAGIVAPVRTLALLVEFRRVDAVQADPVLAAAERIAVNSDAEPGRED